MRGVAVALLLVLAGCADGGSAPDEDEFEDLGGTVTSTTGLIRGVVFDQSIQPIEGATVSIQSLDRTATTSAEGAFVIDDLEPGVYFLHVDKIGFEAVQQSTTVEAGVERPEIVKVQLIAAPSTLPRVFPLLFEGYIECSTGVGTPVVYAYYSACSGVPQLFPEDRFAVTFEVGTEYPEFVQAEMVWESTQTLSDHLGHNFYYPDPSHTDGNADDTESGGSPLTNSMDNETAREYLEGLDYEVGEELLLRQRVFTRATDGQGLALTLKQSFSIYTHLFYNWAPEEGWTFVADGAPVPPS